MKLAGAAVAGMEVPAHFRGAAMGDGPDGPPLCLAGPGIFPQPGGQEAAQRVDDGGDHFPRSSILTRKIAAERLYQSPAILLAAMSEMKIDHGGLNVFMT